MVLVFVQNGSSDTHGGCRDCNQNSVYGYECRRGYGHDHHHDEGHVIVMFEVVS